MAHAADLKQEVEVQASQHQPLLGPQVCGPEPLTCRARRVDPVVVELQAPKGNVGPDQEPDAPRGAVAVASATSGVQVRLPAVRLGSLHRRLEPGLLQ
eukprot:3500797-Pyramimonas_sp.AAC.1